MNISECCLSQEIFYCRWFGPLRCVIWHMVIGRFHNRKTSLFLSIYAQTACYQSLNPLLVIWCRDLCHHKEAYVRRAVLFTASCVLVSLHPSYVASSLIEGNSEISQGLEWIRTWAIHIADSDTDRECYTVSFSSTEVHY